jgi:ribokinase
MRVAVLGNVNADVSYDVARLPEAGETLLAEGLELGAGGKATNAAIALARLGATPRLIGCVGDDALGTVAVGALERAGVATGDLRRTGAAPTGLATVLVFRGAGENAIVTHLGANLQLGPQDVPALDDCAALLLTLGLTEPTLLAGVAAARAAGIPVIADTTPLRGPALPRELTAVDLLSANRVEAQRLTGVAVAPGDADSAQDACAALHALGAARVVLKLGAEGARWSDGERDGHVAAPATTAVDPTGAGDAFMAGLTVAWLDGATLADATAAACAEGARAAATRGAQLQD